MILITQMRELIRCAGEQQLAPLDTAISQAAAVTWAQFRLRFPAVHPSRAGEIAERWATRWILRGKIARVPKACHACPARFTKDVKGHWVRVYCVRCEMKAIRAELAKLNVTADPSEF